MVHTTSASSAASPTSTEQLRRRVPWISLFSLVLLVVVTIQLAVRASVPLTDPDTWWHLRLGEEFRDGWSLSTPGHLTPFGTEPWFATQWTLEVLASLGQDRFGLVSVSWLAGLGVVLLSTVLFVICRRDTSTLAAACAAATAVLATSMSHGPRPQMASFVLVAVFTALWLRSAEDLEPRWWLIPLTWLWACTHGMWFIGPLVGFLVVLGLALDRRLSRRAAWRLASIPVGGLLAAALTPVGPRLVLAPLATSQMADFVTEWQPPNFTEFVPAVAAGMVAAVAFSWARSNHRRSWPEIFVLMVAAGWIVLSYRTVAVGAVMVAPLLAGTIQAWLPMVRGADVVRDRLFFVTASVAIVVGLAIAAPFRGTAPLDEAGRLNKALNELPGGTVIFNDYPLGGWLEWRHRDLVPVIDGLTDAYAVTYVASYSDAWKCVPGWETFVAGTGAEYALLRAKAPLAGGLMNRNWKPIVRESGYVLLSRTATDVR